MTACDVCHAGWYAAARWGLGDLMECRLPSFPRSFSSFCLDPSPDRKSDNTNDDARVLSSLLSPLHGLLPSLSVTHSLTYA